MGIKVSLKKGSAEHAGIEKPLDDMEPLAHGEEPLGNQKPQGCHSIFCWSVKVCCGTVLIASSFICTLYGLQPWFTPPLFLAQTLIVVGGLSGLFHYRKLESFSCRFAQPDILVTDQALYRFIRHPMYFSDSFVCMGLFLLFPTIPSVFVLALGTVALIRQSKEEDRYLAQRFNQEFTRWKKRTKLIIPFIY